MTETMMNVRTLLEKTADADVVRDMIKFAAQRLMELDVEALTGAAHGVRDPNRVNQRNGYRPRDWETRAGTVEWAVQRSRYMTLETIANLRDDDIVGLSVVAP